MGCTENDGKKGTPQTGAVLFALPPVDLDELALGIAVALDDARHAGAHLAQALRIAKPEASVAHLVATCRSVAGVAVNHCRHGIGPRSMAVDREGLWAAIRDAFAKGAERELTRRPA